MSNDTRLPKGNFTNGMSQTNLCFPAKQERHNDNTMLLNPLNRKGTGHLTVHTWRLNPMKLTNQHPYNNVVYEQPDSSV